MFKIAISHYSVHIFSTKFSGCNAGNGLSSLVTERGCKNQRGLSNRLTFLLSYWEETKRRTTEWWNDGIAIPAGMGMVFLLQQKIEL